MTEKDKLYADKLKDRALSDYERLDHAINELERQTCKDCISRQDAIRIAEQGQVQGYEWQFKKLCNLPHVTPTRPHGEWEEIVVLPRAYDIMGNKTWASQMRCNKCEFTTFAVEGKFSQYNFCPECGADMREVESDNNL